MAERHFYFDPHASGTAVFMGPTEAILMELAWQKKTLTVKKALFLLGPENKLAYTTVMTVLGRLADKGFLKKVKEGKSFVYEPAIEKQKFVKQQIKIINDCLRNFKN